MTQAAVTGIKAPRDYKLPPIKSIVPCLTPGKQVTKNKIGKYRVFQPSLYCQNTLRHPTE